MLSKPSESSRPYSVDQDFPSEEAAADQQSLSRNRPVSFLRTTGWIIALLALTGVAALLIAGFEEMRSSKLQARLLTPFVEQLKFQLEPGANPAPVFPVNGPYDTRLGYTSLPAFTTSLTGKGFEITAQAQWSPSLKETIDRGLFPPYHEKSRAGLIILDRRGENLFQANYPERGFANFEQIPPLVVQTLLYIENRELLDDRYPQRNPAVEWDRLVKVAVDLAVDMVKRDGQKTAGGSTLATQIEKYRHSPDGITFSAREKLRQMASASLRAYLDGKDTMAHRRRLVLDYINTVPLAAHPSFGEVNGLGDGLWAWYGSSLAETSTLLADSFVPDSEAKALARAVAYKQVLSLFLAQRRPTHYLGTNPDDLNRLADVYLNLLCSDGIINAELRDQSLRAGLARRGNQPVPASVSFVASKATTAVRSKLATLLHTKRFYDLDRLDLTVGTTIDKTTQDRIGAFLRSLKDQQAATAAGLFGERLLADNNDLSKITYSFTLFEATGQGNLVRIQTDNLDQPFDVNEGVKLDLGSTAKLRTLVTYLDVIAALHRQYTAIPPEQLAEIQVEGINPLASWALEFLKRSQDKSLTAILEAAMLRTYSANPSEKFYTGGGLHTFENFQKEDNGKILTVQDALRESVNLVFVRLMRDIVRYYTWQNPGSTARLMQDTTDPRRLAYLARFAEKEGGQFVQRFYRKYIGKNSREALERLAGSTGGVPSRLATIFNTFNPGASREDFALFLREIKGDHAPTDKEVDRLFDKYRPGNFDLPDLGYLARVHPLELWVAGYLKNHPNANLAEVLAASTDVRQEVYRWLFKTRNKNTQDTRIRSLLEMEAFLEIHRQWQRMGYPFDSLVPSFATSIGSSADRPAALAELMGIIVNNGVYFPTVRIEKLHFASATPYETVFDRLPAAGEQVLAPEIAATVRRALIEVVEHGTARRLQQPFTLEDGTTLVVGGKTGTGDHREEKVGPNGRILQTRVMNRTATFVFFIGDRYFGTMTAFVPGSQAAAYHFTSGLPVQVLKTLAPTLTPLIREAAEAEKARSQQKQKNEKTEET